MESFENKSLEKRRFFPLLFPSHKNIAPYKNKKTIPITTKFLFVLLKEFLGSLLGCVKPS